MTLREVDLADLPVFFEHQADPVAVALADFPSRTRDGFMAHWSAVLEDPTVIARTVLAGDTVVGNIVSFLREDQREIGYWIGREFWGRGIATSAVRQFLRIELRRPLFAGVATANAASIRVLEKSRFRRLGEADGLAELVLDD